MGSQAVALIASIRVKKRAISHVNAGEYLMVAHDFVIRRDDSFYIRKCVHFEKKSLIYRRIKGKKENEHTGIRERMGD